MQDELIKQAEALAAKLDEALQAKQPNPAAWKSRQKVATIITLLKTEWPKPEAGGQKAEAGGQKPEAAKK